MIRYWATYTDPRTMRWIVVPVYKWGEGPKVADYATMRDALARCERMNGLLAS